MERAKTLINTKIEKRFAKLEQIRKEKEMLRAASANLAEKSDFFALLFRQ
jgi:hypothetical protein